MQLVQQDVDHQAGPHKGTAAATAGPLAPLLLQPVQGGEHQRAATLLQQQQPGQHQVVVNQVREVVGDEAAQVEEIELVVAALQLQHAGSQGAREAALARALKVEQLKAVLKARGRPRSGPGANKLGLVRRVLQVLEAEGLLPPSSSP